MTTTEFSDRFDILYNNLMSNAAPGINSYEKSVFLTKALDEILKSHLNPKGNKYLEGFNDSNKRLIDFSNLISIGSGEKTFKQSRIDPRAEVFKLPDDVFVLINEVYSHPTGVKLVIPISPEEYSRIMSRPYKRPYKNLVWKLIGSGSDEGIEVEIIPPYYLENIETSYIIKYIRRPRPIILVDLTLEYGSGVSINGVSTISECELNPILHEEVLQRAIELAKAAYTGDVNSQLQIGQRSE